MADIDTVLERLVSDGKFRKELGKDPASALAGYDLSAEDLQLLASSLDDGDTAQRGVEQRTSKSAVVGLLASLTGGGGGAGGQLHTGKDSSSMSDLAAPRDDSADALHKLPGKPKPGEITLTKMVGTSGGMDHDTAGVSELSAPKDDLTQASLKHLGTPKYDDITRTPGAVAGNEAPPDAGASPGVEAGANRGWPLKYQPPAVDSASTVAPKKLDFPAMKAGDTSRADLAGMKAGDTAPADLAGMKAGDTTDLTGMKAGDTADRKLDITHMKAGDTSARKLDIPAMKAGDTSVDAAAAPPEDFLTIEDA